jgi:hypothetical protein
LPKEQANRVTREDLVIDGCQHDRELDDRGCEEDPAPVIFLSDTASSSGRRDGSHFINEYEQLNSGTKRPSKTKVSHDEQVDWK